MEDIFCKIVKKKLPAKFIYEDEDFVVFEDIRPQAPIHLLIVPKKHFDEIHNSNHKNLDLLGKMLLVAGQVAKKLGIDKKGYRLILNQGADGGQVVPHLHMHLLGGKKLGPKIVR